MVMWRPSSTKTELMLNVVHDLDNYSSVMLLLFQFSTLYSMLDNIRNTYYWAQSISWYSKETHVYYWAQSISWYSLEILTIGHNQLVGIH